MVIDDDQDVASEVGSTRNKRRAPSILSSRSQQSHVSGKSTRSALGYSPIPPDLVQQNKAYICKWMNFIVLS